MIKSIMIIVLFVTGCLCKAIPEEVTVPDSPEERTSISNEESSTVSKPENTQQLSKEPSIEDIEETVNSESPEQSAESKSANLDTEESKDIQVRSTENSKAAKSENNEESPVTNLDAISSENADISTIADSNDSKGDEVTRTSRNSEANGSAETKSASVETETGDNASHINVKEQAKQAPEEEDMPSENASEENSETVAEEKETNVASNGESQSSDEEPQVRAASPEVNRPNSSDKDISHSAETLGDAAGLIRYGTDALLDLPVNRRMFNDNSKRQHKEVENNTSESAETKTAPQEDTPSSGHEVHSNYLGGSRSGQSEYPYSPLETASRSGYTDILHNHAEKNRNEPLIPTVPPRPLSSNERMVPPPQRMNNAIRHLPPLKPPQKFGPYRPPPPPQPPSQLPLQTYRPWPLPPPEQFFPQPHQLGPPFRPGCTSCNSFPIPNWQPPQFQKLLPPWSVPTLPARNPITTRMFPVNNNPNMFPMIRSAVSEGLAAVQTTPTVTLF